VNRTRRHFSGKETGWKLAEELKIQPGLVHYWIHQVLARSEMTFEKSPEDEPPRRQAEQL
jgi:hypothetical protein